MKSRPKRKATRVQNTEEERKKKQKENQDIKKMIIATEFPRKKKMAAPSTFRSNLKPMVDLIEELKEKKLLTAKHAELFDKTPFALLFQAFNKGVLKITNIRKPHGVIGKIMETYSKEQKAFIFAGKKVELKEEDVAVTFGLPMYGKLVSPYSGARKENIIDASKFYRRYWSEHNTSVLKKVDVLQAIRSCLMITNDTAAEDFVKLLIMYMFMTIFNPGSSYVIRISFIEFIDDLKTMKSIAWASVIHKLLMENVEAWRPECPFVITTCAIQLVYFLLEHTNIAKPLKEYDDTLPRFTKWNISQIRVPNDLKTSKDIMVFPTLTIRSLLEEALVEKVKDSPEELNAESPEKQIQRLLVENKKLEKKYNKIKDKHHKLKIVLKEISGREFDESEDDCAEEGEVEIKQEDGRGTGVDKVESNNEKNKDHNDDSRDTNEYFNMDDEEFTSPEKDGC